MTHYAEEPTKLYGFDLKFLRTLRAVMDEERVSEEEILKMVEPTDEERAARLRAEAHDLLHQAEQLHPSYL